MVQPDQNRAEQENSTAARLFAWIDDQQMELSQPSTNQSHGRSWLAGFVEWKLPNSTVNSLPTLVANYAIPLDVSQSRNGHTKLIEMMSQSH